MDEYKGLNTTVDPKLIRPDFVMKTNVVFRVMRLKERSGKRISMGVAIHP